MHAKQYIALAKLIQRTTTGEYLARYTFIQELCDILAAENPKFSKEKFMEAVK